MAAIIGIDDTDSRDRGMCTTYVGTMIANQLAERGWTVRQPILFRCNPAVQRKTRGNAAVAVPTDADATTAFDIASNVVEHHAVTADPATNPGLVVADHSPETISPTVAEFAMDAVRTHHVPADAVALINDCGYKSKVWEEQWGLIGALAAIGAWDACEDWTYECILYRDRQRWGTDRVVDTASVFTVADRWYPEIWDTVDRETGEPVCIPNTPGPVLLGIRGESPSVTRAAATAIEGETPTTSTVFRTNQGTDMHLQAGEIGELTNRHCYRVTGEVRTSPETRRGGHVFFTLGDQSQTIDCAAFEPTKRFRDRVRSLRIGDRIMACGEVTDGTLKLEKFAVRDLVDTIQVTPNCPDCGRSMESAGANQGYRCRSCTQTAPGKVSKSVSRTLSIGWYEVPPVARRHIAKPLVRGGFDAQTYPEQ